MKRIITFLFSALLLCCVASAQGQQPVKWKASYQMGSNGEGTITLTATIDKGWHLYDTKLPDVGPVPTSFTFDGGEGIKFIGGPTAKPAPMKVSDEMFGCDLTYWENKVTFTQKFKRVNKKSNIIAVTVTYMCCNDANCMPPTSHTFTLDINSKK